MVISMDNFDAILHVLSASVLPACSLLCSCLSDEISTSGPTAEKLHARAACRCLKSDFHEALDDAQQCTILKPDWYCPHPRAYTPSQRDMQGDDVRAVTQGARMGGAW